MPAVSPARSGGGGLVSMQKTGVRPFLTMVQGLCLLLPLGGCLLSGDKPEPGLDIPQAYELGPKNPAVAEAALPTLDWWRGFRSKELNELIEEARAANLDIAVAVAQIVQADA
jgi:multidrug efflux system outer membrane protein